MKVRPQPGGTGENKMPLKSPGGDRSELWDTRHPCLGGTRGHSPPSSGGSRFGPARPLPGWLYCPAPSVEGAAWAGASRSLPGTSNSPCGTSPGPHTLDGDAEACTSTRSESRLQMRGSIRHSRAPTPGLADGHPAARPGTGGHSWPPGVWVLVEDPGKPKQRLQE